jgi:hypothetical protein
VLHNWKTLSKGDRILRVLAQGLHDPQGTVR